MTQKEFFSKTNTDHLLSMRYRETCHYPEYEGQTPNFCNDSGIMYYINKQLLYEELSRRPHRIRKRHLRKKKIQQKWKTSTYL